MLRGLLYESKGWRIASLFVPSSRSAMVSDLAGKLDRSLKNAASSGLTPFRAFLFIIAPPCVLDGIMEPNSKLHLFRVSRQLLPDALPAIFHYRRGDIISGKAGRSLGSNQRQLRPRRACPVSSPFSHTWRASLGQPAPPLHRRLPL